MLLSMFNYTNCPVKLIVIVFFFLGIANIEDSEEKLKKSIFFAEFLLPGPNSLT